MQLGQRVTRWKHLATWLVGVGVVVMLAATGSAHAAVTKFSLTGSRNCSSCLGGVATDPSGNVYGLLGSGTGPLLQKFSNAGTYLAGTGELGTGTSPIQFSEPMALTSDPSGHVFVASYDPGNIVELDSNLNYLQTITPNGGPAITGVAANGSSLYVVTLGGGPNNGMGVLKLANDGTFGVQATAAIPGGSAAGHLTSGFDSIAVDANGNVFIGDTRYDRVEELDANLNFVGEWSTPGQPNGIAIGSVGGQEQVYVQDDDDTTSLQTVERYSPSGVLQGTYSDAKPGGTAAGAAGIATDGSGNVFAGLSGNLIERIDSTPDPAIGESPKISAPGQSVTFDDSASETDLWQVADSQWDLDGSQSFATEAGATATATRTFAAPGVLPISVRVTASNGRVATTTVNHRVAASPTAAVTGPQSGQTYAMNQSVATGLVCSEGAYGPGIASCTDSTGGSGDNGHLETSSPGTHTYIVTAVSRDGQSSTASITYHVAAAPTVAIASPADGQNFQLGQSIATSFTCADGANGPGITSCLDSHGAAAPAGRLDTSSYGQHTYAVSAVSRDGQRTTRSVSYTVAPSGRVGFVINNGDYATNDPHVTIEPVWPQGANSILASNDGGFGSSGNATTFGLAGQIPWTLRQTGSDRLPKTIYLRYLGAGSDNQNFTDDIILDEQIPTLSSAQLVGPSGAAAAQPSHVVLHGVRTATARTRRYALKLRAQDTIVGLCQVAVSSQKRGGSAVSIKSCHRRGLVRVNRVVSVASATRPRFVRVKNAAGTWSPWRRIR